MSDMVKRRRVVQAVTPQDEIEGDGWGAGGRAKIYGHGSGWWADLAGIERGSASKAAWRGEFTPWDPVSVIQWALRVRSRRMLGEVERAAATAGSDKAAELLLAGYQAQQAEIDATLRVLDLLRSDLSADKPDPE